MRQRWFWSCGLLSMTNSIFWVQLLVLAFVWLAKLLHARGARYNQIGAAEAQRRDTRPPVLYLRSFMDDELDVTAHKANEELRRLEQIPIRCDHSLRRRRSSCTLSARMSSGLG